LRRRGDIGTGGSMIKQEGGFVVSKTVAKEKRLYKKNKR
jgi:hypothetical protein